MAARTRQARARLSPRHSPTKSTGPVTEKPTQHRLLADEKTVLRMLNRCLFAFEDAALDDAPSALAGQSLHGSDAPPPGIELPIATVFKQRDGHQDDQIAAV